MLSRCMIPRLSGLAKVFDMVPGSLASWAPESATSLTVWGHECSTRKMPLTAILRGVRIRRRRSGPLAARTPTADARALTECDWPLG